MKDVSEQRGCLVTEDFIQNTYGRKLYSFKYRFLAWLNHTTIYLLTLMLQTFSQR